MDQNGDAASHYYRCENCGCWVDASDLAQVVEHEHAALCDPISNGFEVIRAAPLQRKRGH